MQGIAGVDLPRGKYRIRRGPDAGSIADKLLASTESGPTTLHLHDVVGPNRETVLEVRSRPVSTDALLEGPSESHVLGPPDGRPAIELRPTRFGGAAVLDARSNTEIGTIRQAYHVFGPWQFRGVSGSVRAELGRDRWLKTALSPVQRASYEMRDDRGSTIGRLVHERGEGINGAPWESATVDVRGGHLPTELLLAFAYAVYDAASNGKGVTG